MLGVVVVPIVLLVWVSFWGGRAFSTASPLTFDNYAKFFANQTYLKLALTTIVHTATLMAVTGVLGYCIAYFLVMKVKSPGWRLALFLAFIVPFWTSDLDPRHRLGAVPGRQRRDQPDADVRRRHPVADRGVPLFAHRHHHGAGLALHHDGGRVRWSTC